MALNVTDEEKNEILKYRKAGYALIDIAVIVGRSLSSVKRVCRAYRAELLSK